MAVRLRWHRNSHALFLVMLKLRIDLFGRLQSHGAAGQGEVVETVPLKTLIFNIVRRETERETERERARQINKEVSEG